MQSKSKEIAVLFVILVFLVIRLLHRHKRTHKTNTIINSNRVDKNQTIRIKANANKSMEGTKIIPKRAKKTSNVAGAAAAKEGAKNRNTKDESAGVDKGATTLTRDERITRSLSSTASISTVTGATSTAAGGVTTDAGGETTDGGGAGNRRRGTSAASSSGLLSAQESGTLDSVAKDLRGNSDDSMSLPLSLSLVKGLRRKSSSIGVGSSSTGGGSNGSGNNSDNSALVSLGNNSFGFNFDSEEGMMGGNGSPPDADKSSSSDSDNGTEKRRGRRSGGGGGSKGVKGGGKAASTGGATGTGGGTRAEVTASSSCVSALTNGAVAVAQVQVSRTPSSSGSVPGQVSTKRDGLSGRSKGHHSHSKKRRMADREREAGGSSNGGGSSSKKSKQGSQPMPPESKPSSSSLDSHRSGGSNGSSEDGSGSGNDSGTSGSSGDRSSGSGSNANGSRSSSGKSTVSSLTMSSNPNDSNGGGSPSSGDHEADQAEASFTNLAAASTAEEAAAAAVAHLQSIASAVDKKAAKDAKKNKTPGDASSEAPKKKKEKAARGQKRKAENNDDDDDGDSGGYNSDDEGGMAASRSRTLPMGADSSSGAAQNTPAVAPLPVQSSAAVGVTALPPTGKKARTNPSLVMPPPAAQPVVTTSSSSNQVASTTAADSDMPDKKKIKLSSAERREERNQREKERSFRISKQINELRGLLSSGGVIVPKGTKSAVLSEAANYIRMLQQHQYKSEIDRAQLIQQMQIIGGGALGPQAASAVRHVAAQNGVWSLGNFGGVPPRSAMQLYQQDQGGSQAPPTGGAASRQSQPQAPGEPQIVTSVDEHDYRFIFNSCSVGMAIASMGGAFIDCNQLFCQLSQYSKQEVCSMTIFNLTSRQDLQIAFDLISKMISPPPEGLNSDGNPPACVLRGAMKHRNDLGLSISLIKGEDGIAKCFCITLIKNPASPYDTARPIPATADFLRAGDAQMEQSQITTSSATEQKRSSPASNRGNMNTHAYTAG